MAFQALDVMKRASIILQDDEAVRWTAPELLDYLNDGLGEIVLMKPNANTKTVNLSLAAGAKQTLAAEYSMLLRVVCNRITGNDSAIRPIASRSIIDAQIPNWQNSTALPQAAAVVHVIHDLADPRTFYVVPGNNGSGVVEAVVGALPAVTAAPSAPANLLIENYAANVDIPDIYRTPLIDYVLYRAFSKDAGMQGGQQRAVAHYELFKTAIAGFASAENALTLAASARRASAG
jgi:hypothetical protein